MWKCEIEYRMHALELPVQIHSAARYQRFNHGVGRSLWHLSWETKYRMPLFRTFADRFVAEDAIRTVAERHNIALLELAVQPDHVHVVCSLSLDLSPAQALQLLKGGSSHLLSHSDAVIRSRCPLGHLWSPAKFAASVGTSDLPRVLAYVRNQAQQQWKKETT